MVSVEDDDLAGLEDVSSDGEDYNYEADSETTSSGVPTRRAHRKRARGEGKSFRVLGFNQSQRASFVQILMRFGTGEYDWADFVPHLKQKTHEEIDNYGLLFMEHLAEGINDSPTFSDGVPKEGLRVQDVLVRIGLMILFRDKVKYALANPEEPLYGDDIVSRYPPLKGGRMWTPEHDLILLRGVRKHGYGKWQSILDDKELKMQKFICQELNLPTINFASLVSNQHQAGSTVAVAGPSGDSQKETVSQNLPAVDTVTGGTDTYTLLYQFREMQRRQVEFIKKRVLLLEKGLYAECQKEYYGPGGVFAEESENENKRADVEITSVPDTIDGLVAKLPRIEEITAKDVYLNTSDTDPIRQELGHYYNEICKLLAESEKESVKAFIANAPDQTLGKKLHQLEGLCRKISQLFSSTQNSDQKSEQPSGSSSVSKSEMMKDEHMNDTYAWTDTEPRTLPDVGTSDTVVDVKVEAEEGSGGHSGPPVFD